ncbi:MAG TPA: metallophosphoesterase [Candidatus Limnocylindrales bacterium]|jgi:hypothetical protein
MPGARPTGLIRDAALIVVTAVGTLAVLVGIVVFLDTMVGRPGGTATGSPTASPTPRATAPRTAPPPAGSAPPSATPVPSPVGDPVVVGAGDIATCGGPGDEATADLLDSIPGTVFTAGDNAYESGTPEQFAQCYEPSWGRHKARTKPAPGNHDHETDELAGYFGYFGSGFGNAQAPWYSFDLETWHVVVLDSMCSKVAGGCGPSSPQVDWLRADLAANDVRCVAAIWHHPRFSSGVHGDDREVAPFWDALYAAGADLVINGHDHDYERFAAQSPDGTADAERGLREFVVGTGGAELREFSRLAPNSLVRASVSHGVIAFTLRPTGYEWRFVATDAGFADSGNARCH